MEIKIVNVTPQDALAIKDNCTQAELGSKFGELYGEIGKYAADHSIKMNGYPFGIYRAFSAENVELEAGFPVEGAPKGEGRIYLMQTYAGKAAMTTFTGPYEKLNEAWGKFAKLVDDAGHKLAGSCFEVYITDPEVENDSSKWITELYTPIE